MAKSTVGAAAATAAFEVEAGPWSIVKLVVVLIENVEYRVITAFWKVYVGIF
jgi:hypothetical protein